MTNPALGDLILPATVKRAGDNVAYPILSMTMHQGLVDQEGRFKKRIASQDVANYKVVSRNQLVVGFPMDEGVLAFQRKYEEAIVSPAYEVWQIRDEERVDPSYLELFLRSPRALHYYASKLRGTTARRRVVPVGDFVRMRVPLPSFGEQQRIASILDRTKSLGAMHRESQRLLDELTQSIFVQMFGRPDGEQRYERFPLSA